MGERNSASWGDVMTTNQTKKVELSRQHKLENLLIYNLITFSYIFPCAKWYVTLCLIQWRKRKQLPQRPVTIVLFGSSPTEAIELLKSYGIYACPAAISWAVHWNKVNLKFSLFVSLSQFDIADNIVFQYGSDAFQVVTNAGDKRGQTLPGQFALRLDKKTAHTKLARQSPGAKKPARLGKCYR